MADASGHGAAVRAIGNLYDSKALAVIARIGAALAVPVILAGAGTIIALMLTDANFGARLDVLERESAEYRSLDNRITAIEATRYTRANAAEEIGQLRRELQRELDLIRAEQTRSREALQDIQRLLIEANRREAGGRAGD